MHSNKQKWLQIGSLEKRIETNGNLEFSVKRGELQGIQAEMMLGENMKSSNAQLEADKADFRRIYAFK